MLKGNAKKKLGDGFCFSSTEKTNWLHVTFGGSALQRSAIPRVSKFFLFLDVAVCVKVAMELPLVQLVDLVLLHKQNKSIQASGVIFFFFSSFFFSPRREGINTVVWTPHAVSVVTQTQSIYDRLY